MLKRCQTDDDIREIMEYIGPEKKRVPYIYLNATKYGKGTENIFTWIDVDSTEQIRAIYLLYFNCLHFFTKDDNTYPVQDVLEIINRFSPKVIMTLHEFGERLTPYLGSEYSVYHNHIMDMDGVGNEGGQYEGRMASESDIEQIIQLLMENEEYNTVYDEEDLRKQLFDRLHEGFSRYFAIYRDGRVVASCSTYGETPDFAIVGGVIVHPEYRRKGFASRIDQFACNTLHRENISTVSFVSISNTASFAMHLGIGSKDIGIMDKFVRVPSKND